MNNFIFENATKVLFGKGCVKEYLCCLIKGCGDTVMLAYGGGSIKKNGVYDEVVSILKKAGKNIVEFSGIMANPTYAKVLEGAKLARESQAGLILGVGGGSVMDCCKAVSIAARYDGDVWEDFWARPGIFDFEPLPLGVIVTVAGTGSECNGGAVITNEELKIKTGRDYPRCNPRFALLDPTYTYSVPKFQMVSGSFDILSHIMEIYFSGPDEDNVSDDIAEALMRNVIRNLRAAIRNPEDYTARSNLMWDATMAENRIIKLGKRTDFQCHQMEHQLGAYTDCNHGAGLAVLHPTYYRHIYKDGLAKFKRFATEVWDISSDRKTDEETARAGIDELERFIREIGLPATLQELGIHGDVDLKAVADSCAVVPGSYRKLTQEEIFEIFKECF
ncbi:iron-containing alcohol dehydrogenase [Hominisplanchenecus murintestinalis]|uniref:Iron-containing alcohol dehydrogenase n=1 Tax=Hominisplanchenecus murintestinalis TaxID=2941517 RepID=A0AC61QWJ7_9FIRM|nr:iron-containing alcohol dehydrogenase [Hominisplanchenecus murintestinalis]NBH99543.1 iron-containing alcohol dehydrogenase [Lachnospiraceae bacterium]NBI76857.1 iron-containing alcohol dehydrogenase [Lachnospiraceae bacterium]RKJ76408.1 iron-containing alcohol dehydrogenase [Anaerotruncus sp. 1XD22-93]TGX97034.1 iron-containing alcohol dehydrogenase [Hominisplanchenecus murintestinalis]